jgi:hypothetical protein
MDMKNNLALRKKRELLGGITKRKMSLRKYMDNIKQNECRLDITQITKCVFLGSLCLKPVPQLFESPLLLEELDMRVGNVKSSISINDENLDEPFQTSIIKDEATPSNLVKKGGPRKKCLNVPKIKKKTLREKYKLRTTSNSLINVKNESAVFENNESVEADDIPLTLPINNNNQMTTASCNSSNGITTETDTSIILSEVNDAPYVKSQTVEKSNEQQNNIRFEDVNIEQKFLTEPTLNSSFEDSDNIPPDIKSGDSVEIQYNDVESLKRESTPELILSDSDEDAIDQLMFNIMDIKVGPNVFEKEFFDMPPSDIEEYDEYTSEFNEKDESTDTNESKVKVKKFIKRNPQCKICSQVFSSYMQLKEHKEAHKGDRPYLCLKCNENYNSLDQLIAHLRKHQGKRPYVCKKCNEEFKTIKALEEHKPVHVLQKVVPHTKTFKCEVCAKEFRKLCDLERHTRVHTGEKPSVCNICNRRFQQAHNLNKHLLIHTQEKPFECDICNKKFGRNDVLNRHLLTHSVKKPNHCKFCSKSFIRISQLLAHKEKYHSKETS